MARFLVIGAAGHAQEVAWSLREQCAALGRDCELMFFDDRIPTGELASGLGAVEGDLDAVAHHADEDARLVLGIGRPRTKAAVRERLAGLALPWATVIHPTALVGPAVSIGEGSYVGAGAVLTVNARVGRFVTVNLHALVTHDDVIGDFATLHPNVRLSGGVVVGDGCELGTGAIAIPGTRIGEWAILGAGAVAVRPLAGHATYVGVPARALSHVP
jgi:sugar O-acyltransferase (sialic acid O-acetyltransferase NeuD family)